MFGKSEQLPQTERTIGGPKGDYFIFRFDEEVSIGAFDIGRLIAWHRLDKDHVEGRPLFIKGEELLRFRGPL